MTREAKQFDGTFGQAKELVTWLGDTIACAGATMGYTDDMPGGLNLMTPVTYTDPEGKEKASVHYTDVPKGHWIVRDGAQVVAMSDEQYKIMTGGA